MILIVLSVLPLLAAAGIFLAGKKAPVLGRSLLAGTALLHFGLTIWTLFQEKYPEWSCRGNIWLKLDLPGAVILFITALLFLAVALQTVFWLPAEYDAAAMRHNDEDPRKHFLPEYIFLGCIAAFAGTMTLVITAWNLGLLWVAVEATTLCSAPLILFHRSKQALEAMWKYLLICSVGIAFALFGTLLLEVAIRAQHNTRGLWYELLSGGKTAFDPAWFKAAWIFVLAGYGTKMGLVPFHAWLPDAHSEAPGTVSAMLSGALLNCSLLGILRFYNLAPAEVFAFCQNMLTALGVLSLAVAALFIIRQGDFKRMLAYSSVEHMGLAALLLAHCGDRVMLPHLLGHSMIKMALFLTAGNLLLAYGSRSIAGIGGMLGTLRRNSVVWIGGILLICGAPPSPLFVTEFALIATSPVWLGITVAILLFAIFAGMTMAALHMTMGEPGSLQSPDTLAKRAEKLWTIPGLMCIAAVALGLYMLWGVNLLWSLR